MAFSVVSVPNYNLSSVLAIYAYSLWHSSNGGYRTVNSNFISFTHHIISTSKLSASTAILALYYIKQLRHISSGEIGSEIRVLTIALMLANKFLDDSPYTNAIWSKLSNLPVREINIMEMEFLRCLKHRLFVHHSKFGAWVRFLNINRASLMFQKSFTKPLPPPTLPYTPLSVSNCHVYYNSNMCDSTSLFGDRQVPLSLPSVSSMNSTISPLSYTYAKEEFLRTPSSLQWIEERRKNIPVLRNGAISKATQRRRLPSIQSQLYSRYVEEQLQLNNSTSPKSRQILASY